MKCDPNLMRQPPIQPEEHTQSGTSQTEEKRGHTLECSTDWCVGATGPSLFDVTNYGWLVYQ
jgi:hypothetical protein